MTIDSGRRQYLIKKCVNVKIGHSYNKNSDNRHSVHMVSHHYVIHDYVIIYSKVRDVGCLKCNQNLGWSNEFIAEPKKVIFLKRVACRVNQTVTIFLAIERRKNLDFLRQNLSSK